MIENKILHNDMFFFLKLKIKVECKSIFIQEEAGHQYINFKNKYFQKLFEIISVDTLMVSFVPSFIIWLYNYSKASPSGIFTFGEFKLIFYDQIKLLY